MDDQQQITNQQLPADLVCSGLSGNEMYCAALLGLKPGNLLIGNSVFSMGVIGGLFSNIKMTLGGEINSFTDMIAEGRKRSLGRLLTELQQSQGAGSTGVTNEIVFHKDNIEFLSIGSVVSAENPSSNPFTTSADAQELFCLVDAGYQPLSFVFGNVAYSIGIAGHLFGGLRQIAKGEVKSYSDIFNKTRNLALERIVQEAQAQNANAVLGIETSILPISPDGPQAAPQDPNHGVQEMLMLGTACRHPLADTVSPGKVITSDLTAEETWNIAKLGYMPVELVLGTSVYSLGTVGGLKASLEGLMHGEIGPLTEMIYGAREESISKLRAQAATVSADDVLGIKTYIYQLGGGLIELLAIGTAVKKVDGLATRSPQLPPQAIIRDRDTFFNTAATHFGVDLSSENH